jgi:hypothetical protein
MDPLCDTFPEINPIWNVPYLCTPDLANPSESKYVEVIILSIFPL